MLLFAIRSRLTDSGYFILQYLVLRGLVKMIEEDAKWIILKEGGVLTNVLF